MTLHLLSALLVLLGLVLPGSLKADAPVAAGQSVVWLARPAREAAWQLRLLQLHPGGYVWTRLERHGDRTLDGDERAHDKLSLSIAWKVPNSVYADAQAALAAIGFYPGRTIDCEGTLIGFAPVSSSLAPGPFCSDAIRALAAAEQTLLSEQQLLTSLMELALKIASANAVSNGTGVARVAGSLVQGPSGWQPAAADSTGALPLPSNALANWPANIARVDLDAETRLSMVHLTISEPSGNGLQLGDRELTERSTLTSTSSSAAAGLVREARVPAGVVRWQGPLEAAATISLYAGEGTHYLAFTTALWTSPISLTLHGSDGSRVRLSSTRSGAYACAGRTPCKVMAPEEARAIAALALGECRHPPAPGAAARVRAARSTGLTVSIGAERCTLELPDECLAQPRPGLVRLVQLLGATATQSLVACRPGPKGPIIHGSSRAN